MSKKDNKNKPKVNKKSLKQSIIEKNKALKGNKIVLK